VLRQAQKVRSVSGGIVTLDVSEQPVSGSMTVDGRTERMPPEAATRYTVRMTQRGKFLSRTDGSGGAGSGLGGTGTPLDTIDVLHGLNFPNRDVKPGDTWSDTLTVGPPGEKQKVNVTWTFAGREKLQGRDCAKITTALSASLTDEQGPGAALGETGVSSSGKISGAITTYFDPQAGQEVYATGHVLLVMRADLSGVSPEVGEFATAMKNNVIQSLIPASSKGSR
jgi:hypothetical protein